MSESKYNEHLSSKEWAAMRRTAMRRAKYACEICGAKRISDNPLHVHHLTYERMGSEDIDDLVVLCEDCHNEVHEFVDYAILKSRPFIGTTDEEGWEYEQWMALPHMRRSPLNLLPIILATLYNKPLRHYAYGAIDVDSAPHYDVAEINLRDLDGTWYFQKCQSVQEVFEFLAHLKKKGYNTEKAESQLSSMKMRPIYIRYDHPNNGVSIGDELSARYEFEG